MYFPKRTKVIVQSYKLDKIISIGVPRKEERDGNYIVYGLNGVVQKLINSAGFTTTDSHEWWCAFQWFWGTKNRLEREKNDY